LQFIMQTPFVVILLSVAAESAWLPPPIDLNQQVTLDGGRQPGEGNVLINGRPVCDDMWDDKDAEVVCRMLGYNSGQATSYSTFGQVDTSFIMDDVQCSGYETNITYCPHNSQHNCASYEGAGVRCHQIKLTGGSDYSEGNVLINGKPICDDDWDNRDAAVICRMIGFWSGVAVSNSAFGQVDDDFVMDDVKCGGDESNIFNCVYASQHNCRGHEGAGVRCEREPSNNYYGSTTTTRYETTTSWDDYWTTTASGQCVEWGYECYDSSMEIPSPNCCEGLICNKFDFDGTIIGYCDDHYISATTTTTTTTTEDYFWTTTTSGQCLEEGDDCYQEGYGYVGSCCEGSFCYTIDHVDGFTVGGFCLTDSWETTTTTTTEVPCIVSGEKCWDGENGGLVGNGRCCGSNSNCDVNGLPFNDYFCP